MSSAEPTVPYGYCHCGCGQKTRLAAQTDNGRGIRKGEPRPFIKGHSAGRSFADDYRVDAETGCWVWQHHLTADGYGKLQVRRVRVGAHRWYYEHANGQVPDGLELDHLCRNRACVNPDHLEPVSTAENVRRGANAKLTAEDVREIRASSATGVSLAAAYGVSAAKISQIRLGQAWKGV